MVVVRQCFGEYIYRWISERFLLSHCSDTRTGFAIRNEAIKGDPDCDAVLPAEKR